jgi:hypothetical protein
MAYEEPLGAKARRVFGNLLSFRGRERLTSWGVAGVLAYALFYLPEQRKQEQIKVGPVAGAGPAAADVGATHRESGDGMPPAWRLMPCAPAHHAGPPPPACSCNGRTPRSAP